MHAQDLYLRLTDPTSKHKTVISRGTFDQMFKRLHIRLNEQSLIDMETWMIDSTAIRAPRASSGTGKKGGLKNRKITRSGAAREA